MQVPGGGDIDAPGGPIGLSGASGAEADPPAVASTGGERDGKRAHRRQEDLDQDIAIGPEGEGGTRQGQQAGASRRTAGEGSLEPLSKMPPIVEAAGATWGHVPEM